MPKTQEKNFLKNKLLVGVLMFTLFLVFNNPAFAQSVSAEDLLKQIQALQNQVTVLQNQQARAVSGGGTIDFSQNLYFGLKHPEVELLQQTLSKDSAIYPGGLVTGYFGFLTQKAVKKFQAKYGIAQTGYVGLLTRAKLNELFGGGGGTKNFSLKIISPNGGEKIAVNDTVEVRWSLSPAPPSSHTLILSLFDGPTPGIVASLRPIPQSGKYSWKVLPSITQGDMVFMLQSGSYRMKASLYDGAPCLGLCPPTNVPQPKLLNEDISDAPFVVAKQATSTNY